MALWQPTDLGASLIAWWSADDPADGAVTTWTDRVGGLAPTQGTAARRPVRAATSFNSAYPGVTFDGTDDRVGGGGMGSLPVGTASSDIYALVSQNVVGSDNVARTLCSYGTASGHGARVLQNYRVSGVNRLRAFDTTTSVIDTAFDFSGNHIVGARFDSATATLYFDGRATTPASGSMAFDTGTTASSIGATQAGAAFWVGVIRHIFVTTVLSDANRQRLEGWMAWDTNLTSLLDAGHPYKSAAPQGAITGALAATESGTDSAAISGSVAVSGVLAAAVETSDTAAITGTVAVAGSLAAMETGQDIAAISAGISISGILAAIEVEFDVAAMSGGAIVSGVLAAIEIGEDVAAFALMQREIEANRTLVGSRVTGAVMEGRRSATALDSRRSASTALRGKM